MRKQVAILAGSLIFFGMSLPGYGGTESGGGGNAIEAGFKEATLRVVQEISAMPNGAKKLLKFDPDDLAATLAQPGAFVPHCATGRTLASIQKEGKMARVYPGTMNIVNLDCKHYKLEQWTALFNSNRPWDKIFFLHEGLRIIKKDSRDENDYSDSSSYLRAAREEDDFDNAAFFSLHQAAHEDSRKSKCSFMVFADLHRAEFTVSGQIVRTFHVSGKPFRDGDEVFSDIQKDKDPDTRRSELLGLFKQYHCEGDLKGSLLFDPNLKIRCTLSTPSRADPSVCTVGQKPLSGKLSGDGPSGNTQAQSPAR